MLIIFKCIKIGKFIIIVLIYYGIKVKFMKKFVKMFIIYFIREDVLFESGIIIFKFYLWNNEEV